MAEARSFAETMATRGTVKGLGFWRDYGGFLSHSALVFMTDVVL
jgi:hypothetical protein